MNWITRLKVLLKLVLNHMITRDEQKWASMSWHHQLLLHVSIGMFCNSIKHQISLSTFPCKRLDMSPTPMPTKFCQKIRCHMIELMFWGNPLCNVFFKLWLYLCLCKNVAVPACLRSYWKSKIATINKIGCRTEEMKRKKEKEYRRTKQRWNRT